MRVRERIFIPIQVRGAMFSLVVVLCRHVPSFVCSCSKLFCPLVLGGLGEGEPVVVGPLWEAVLLVVTTVEVRKVFSLYIPFLV